MAHCEQVQKNLGLNRREVAVVSAVVAGYTDEEISDRYTITMDAVTGSELIWGLPGFTITISPPLERLYET
jgi:hypothetical protein